MKTPFHGVQLADLAPWHAELTALRRCFHQHPELAFAKHHTAATIAQLLDEYGYDVTTGVAGTGLSAHCGSGTPTAPSGYARIWMPCP
ncbi:hypothetical protein SODG_004017 [Sodalis praecaptivus]